MAKDPGLHVMHIAKTGGTTLQAMLKERRLRRTEDGRPVVIHNHSVTLPDILARHRRNQAVFFLREPLARFVSGFNSRQRQGKPEYAVPWKPQEAVAFSYFGSPNELGEGLSAKRPIVQDRAYFALSALPHSRNSYAFYLRDPEYVQRRLASVAFVGFQETFDEDARRLLAMLGHVDDVEVDRLHTAPPTAQTELSDKAVRNLRDWFAADVRLYEWALAQRERLGAGVARTGSA